ncbi:MAG: alpha/beta hydrolase [Propionibacteriaceae bacterium]
MKSLWQQLTRRRLPLDEAPTSAPVRGDAESHHAGDGPVGVLLCHGFTGSPVSMRPWADHLADAGLRVALPRLPGHGTVWQDLNRTSWTDWYAAVERELEVLAADCEQVFVAGLSMGGALALRLAEHHPDTVRGLILVNPAVAVADPRLLALPLLKYMVPSLAGITNDIAKPGVDEGGYSRNPLRALHSQTHLWSDVRARLDQVRQPVLLCLSATDHVIDPSSARILRAELGSTDLTEMVLHRSHHVATLDHDAELIFDGSLAFIQRLTAADAETRA